MEVICMNGGLGAPVPADRCSADTFSARKQLWGGAAFVGASFGRPLLHVCYGMVFSNETEAPGQQDPVRSPQVYE